MKECRQCKNKLDIDAFHNDKSKKDGKRNICKQCASSSSQEWKRKNPPNKQDVKRRNTEYYHSHRCEIKEKSKAYYQSHKSHVLTLEKSRYRKNASAKKIYSSAYRKTNKDKMSIYHKRHYRKYKAYYLLKFKKRRALKHAAIVSGHDITEQMLIDKCRYYGYKCFYCKRNIVETTNNSCPNQLTMDHFTPLSKGGKELLSNYVPSCRPCNCRKHDMPGHDFKRENSSRTLLPGNKHEN